MARSGTGAPPEGCTCQLVYWTVPAGSPSPEHRHWAVRFMEDTCPHHGRPPRDDLYDGRMPREDLDDA